MQIVIDDGNFAIKRKTAVALGNFDGVHLGHFSLLQHTLNVAKNSALAPVVCTFTPHPRKFYGDPTPLICTFEQKMEHIAATGMEICFHAVFNKKFAALTPQEFMLEYIERRLNAKSVLVGSDFYFGKGRSGNAELLQKFCAERGLDCHIIPKLEHNGVPISSTVIRNMVLAGDLSQVVDFLGRPYSCVGVVVKGDQLGRKIGFPTANLELDSELLPPDGVYAGYTEVDGKRYAAMIYKGTRPTVDSVGKMRFEAHLIDYNGQQLYGQRLELFIEQKIRDSMKFASLEELKEQLEKDRLLITTPSGATRSVTTDTPPKEGNVWNSPPSEGCPQGGVVSEKMRLL